MAGAPPGIFKTEWRVGVLMDLIAGDPPTRIKTSPTTPNASSTIADWMTVGASVPGTFCWDIAALARRYLESIPQPGPGRA
ncbi:MAG TPA: hypothetical protein VF371_03915, partial [Candidatus Limnocylindrales bacterium]